MEAVVAMLEAVIWMVQVRPVVRGEVAVHDEAMYCQKASLVHSPCYLMSILSKPCW